MEADIVADSERIGLYKPNSGGAWESREEKSVLVELKEANRKKRLEEEAREKSQAEEIQQNTGTLQTTTPKSRVVLRKLDPYNNPLYLKYKDSANILPNGIPEMTSFQRLWPSTLMVIATFTGCYLLTQLYVPPKASARIFPDMPPSAATAITIIAINAAILVAWRFPPLYRLFNTYFITISAAPRALSLLGNTFSHQSVSHFACNMALLWVVGTRLHDEIGRANFLALYLSAGVFGSYVSLVWFVLRKSFISASLGASGALCGMMGTYLTLDSGAKITFFGFPPENWPALTCLGFLGFSIFIELLGMKRSLKTGMQRLDHTAHLGGYAVGIPFCEMLKRKRRRLVEEEEERRRNLGFVGRMREGTRPNVPPRVA
ncbi:putative Presenilins-associated rhomboid-like protein, mitochondrial [Glarea lozoyensis 74030]|nr:putative Presenilins-associated rhomboid-like protein, mitochondrial [Glarea lozoyensis 74030]